MRWAEIKAVVSDQSADLVANILIEEGCGGAAITGPSVRASGPPELAADLPISKETVLTSYLPVDDRLEDRLNRIRDRIRLLPETDTDVGPGEITIKPVDEADWANAWRSFFKPVEVEGIVIKPSWEDCEASSEKIVVELDPGMAFGTGNHPTTQLCLSALQKYVKGGERVLDVGTGSGILAISAAKLGAGEVIATENDPVAVEAARKNVQSNGVSVKVILSDSPRMSDVHKSDFRGSPDPGLIVGSPENCRHRDEAFDIVVANITANTIIALAPDLVGAMAQGGLLIASGLIEDRAGEVAGSLAELGLAVVEKSVDDEWVALVLSGE